MELMEEEAVHPGRMALMLHVQEEALFACIANNNPVEALEVASLPGVTGTGYSDEVGNTALHLISRSEQFLVCALTLIAKGADLNKTNSSGQSALFYSMWFDQDRLVDVLLESGAQHELEDINESTPLFASAENDSLKVGIDLMTRHPRFEMSRI